MYPLELCATNVDDIRYDKTKIKEILRNANTQIHVNLLQQWTQIREIQRFHDKPTRELMLQNPALCDGMRCQ